MKLNKFNQKYRKGKKDHIFRACQEAMQIMENSYDSTHGTEHVENVLGLLDLMLSKQKYLKVNFDFLTLATCWHVSVTVEPLTPRGVLAGCFQPQGADDDALVGDRNRRPGRQTRPTAGRGLLPPLRPGPAGKLNPDPAGPGPRMGREQRRGDHQGVLRRRQVGTQLRRQAGLYGDDG